MYASQFAAVDTSHRPTPAWVRVGFAACLVLFPLLWGIVAGTDLHPDPSGETAADQVRAVAESARAWQWVHLVLAAASLLGIGCVLALRSLLPKTGRISFIASIAATLGVAGAGLLAGIVFMEGALVAPVSRACASSSACLSTDNRSFLEKFTSAAWNDVTPLSYAAGTLVFSLGTLAVLGVLTRMVRRWEAAVMCIGIVGIYATNTALHGDAKYGLALVLMASASIALRIIRMH